MDYDEQKPLDRLMTRRNLQSANGRYLPSLETWLSDYSHLTNMFDLQMDEAAYEGCCEAGV